MVSRVADKHSRAAKLFVYDVKVMLKSITWRWSVEELDENEEAACRVAACFGCLNRRFCMPVQYIPCS